MPTIVPGSVAIRTGLAVAGAGAVHQSRVGSGKLLVADSEGVRLSWPEVLDHDVDPSGQAPGDAYSLRVLEVEG